MFGNARLARGAGHGALQTARVEVVTAHSSRTRVSREPSGGEDVLPDPFAIGGRVLSFYREMFI